MHVHAFRPPLRADTTVQGHSIRAERPGAIQRMKNVHRIRSLSLLLALAICPRGALAAGTEPPPLACHPVEGLAPLLRPGTILLLGELHGSRESPAIVARSIPMKSHLFF